MIHLYQLDMPFFDSDLDLYFAFVFLLRIYHTFRSVYCLDFYFVLLELLLLVILCVALIRKIYLDLSKSLAEFIYL